jgi:lambda family phage portal protein
VLKQFRSKIARLIAPKGGPVNGRTSSRMYASARASRLSSVSMGASTSSDSELSTSLERLRNQSRALVRDAGFAKRAKTIVVNNVIGHGVGMQAAVRTSRDTLAEPVNDAIEAAFEEWSRADSCHTGGTLHFGDLERVAFGQIFEAGEIIIRKHRSRFGSSQIPFTLELIEPERIADEHSYTAPIEIAPGNIYRMGVEMDQFFRPVNYFIRSRHQSDYGQGLQRTTVERVPAADIYHLRIVDRWPQTRGVPWMHCIIRKLNDIDGYTEAEIVAARSAASYMGFIENSDPDAIDEEEQDDGTYQTELSPGIIEKLRPGEKFNFASPNRPNSQAESFLRFMLREMAAGCDVSYESLSRDYSQSNYSSSRLALLDDRDLWKVFQLWWIRAFRTELHREWLQAAVLSQAITAIPLGQYGVNPRKFEEACFKPRGWSWIDPTREVAAYKEAVRCGFTTVSNVISNTADGRDMEDVLEERERELKMMNDAGLEFETDPTLFDSLGKAIQEPSTDPAAPPDNPDASTSQASNEDPPPRRVFSFPRK